MNFEASVVGEDFLPDTSLVHTNWRQERGKPTSDFLGYSSDAGAAADKC